MSTAIRYPYRKPEIWGGIECTINRIGDNFRDQLLYAGHYDRPDDIRQFAQLGIKKIRYPVLWEHHQPAQDQPIDWSWTEKQLNAIRENNMEPLVGLLHHGSGPVFTSLEDEHFPGKFAEYARMVAEKFPWVKYYTPVNEPLTTARFSGLYGFWYPHATNERVFVKMLLLQVKAIVLAMQAIRAINPEACLVQTEDLSKTHSTKLLQYQAEFENHRRWLTYDLLCGKVDCNHYFWNYFLSLGIEESELLFFISNPCPPGILGFNYYVTSERYLDENIENYPSYTHGGNGKHAYADTEAVRLNKSQGLAVLVKEAWQRYYLPMAVTECHISCTREEQLRWFKETWEACNKLLKKGIDIQAVTAWSLLGAYDWNSLLTVEGHHYESGVFDIQGGSLRPTALAKQLHLLSKGKQYQHPLLNEKGWWNDRKPSKKQSMGKTPPILIIGKNGTLGGAFTRLCEQRSIPYVAVGRTELDICQLSQVHETIEKYKPWAIINAAGYVRVDDAEANYQECFDINAKAPGIIAACCARLGIRFLTFSSDLVFDGEKRIPYEEADVIRPLNVYGASKANAESLVISNLSQALVIRTSAFFGPWDRYNFAYHVIKSLEDHGSLDVPADVVVSPTYVPDLVHTALDLFIDEEEGVWHLANDGRYTWADLATEVAKRAGYNHCRITPRPLIEMGWKAKRPLYSVLGTGKGIRMPAIDNALQRYFEQRAV